MTCKACNVHLIREFEHPGNIRNSLTNPHGMRSPMLTHRDGLLQVISQIATNVRQNGIARGLSRICSSSFGHPGLACALSHAHDRMPFPVHYLAHIARQRLEIEFDFRDEAHIDHACGHILGFPTCYLVFYIIGAQMQALLLGCFLMIQWFSQRMMCIISCCWSETAAGRVVRLFTKQTFHSDAFQF